MPEQTDVMGMGYTSRTGEDLRFWRRRGTRGPDYSGRRLAMRVVVRGAIMSSNSALTMFVAPWRA